ncbi:hypothetical protein GCM10015535_57870 [Streptomyces gelaticus]|uniref:Uncharacterized protein n=1 Tax=Streptomyces gelaticus TaxID=285446 RepID=A0ABQ2W647_9ACTN|nr:hypothetical protein GCM10015535_57870 [Streptomyces gelaticus]
MVGLVPGDVAPFGELGQGRGGIAVREADGVGIDHVLPEPFLLLPLVECRCGVVEGEETLGDLFREVEGVFAEAVVLGGSIVSTSATLWRCSMPSPTRMR